MSTVEEVYPRSLGAFEYGVFKATFEILEPNKFKVSTYGFKPPVIEPESKVYTEFGLADKLFKQAVRQAMYRANESVILYP